MASKGSHYDLVLFKKLRVLFSVPTKMKHIARFMEKVIIVPLFLLWVLEF